MNAISIWWHSHPQRLRSFWPVVGIESSGLVQHQKSAIDGLPVKSSESDWLTMRNEYSVHAQKIGSGQSSRSQPHARRIIGSWDENDMVGDSQHMVNILYFCLPLVSIWCTLLKYEACTVWTKKVLFGSKQLVTLRTGHLIGCRKNGKLCRKFWQYCAEQSDDYA